MIKEEYKYLLLSKIVNEKANKHRAATQIGCTVRNINYLVKQFNPDNINCYRHGNTGKRPANKTDEETVKKIVKLRKDKYLVFNTVHFWEKLNKVEGISVKLVTLKRILRAERLICKTTRKSTIRKYEEEAKVLNKPEIIATIVEKVYQDLILVKDKSHCRISIDPIFGSIVEVDASEFVFFGDTKLHIHVFADRATNKILVAYLDTQETLNGYRHAFMKVLKQYGAPMKLVSDYRGVFSVLRNKNDPENTKLTQFGYWCEKLGIELFCTSVSQKKPWVERVQRILQDRLTSEFSLCKGLDVEKDNQMLDKLIDDINNSLGYEEQGYENVFERFNEDIHGDINIFLSLRYTRKFGSGSTFAVNGSQYFALDYETNKIANFTTYTPLIILFTFDNKMLLNVRKHFFYAVKHEKFKGDKPIDKVKFPPKQTHPWHLLNDFLFFKENNKVTNHELFESVVKHSQIFFIKIRKSIYDLSYYGIEEKTSSRQERW